MKAGNCSDFDLDLVTSLDSGFVVFVTALSIFFFSGVPVKDFFKIDSLAQQGFSD